MSSLATSPKTPQVEVLVFDVTGMDCGDCAKSVERVVGQLPTVGRAEVSFGAGTLTVLPGARRSGSVDDLVRAVGGAVDRAGYTATLRSDLRRGQDGPAWWQNRKV
ncbi:MAG TPA: heavy metal-associated domain-containing protein, partial [Thermomicrobiales bacterium]|nr:heavy metal-associated domain-containing protein [Thermomicrobiales bacterium]